MSIPAAGRAFGPETLHEAAVRGEDMAGHGSHLRLCRVGGRLATLFRVSMVLTPTFASCHGCLPPGGVQKTRLCVIGMLQAFSFRTAQIRRIFLDRPRAPPNTERDMGNGVTRIRVAYERMNS